MRIWAWSLGTLLLAACGDGDALVQAPIAEVGQPAPRFRLRNQDGVEVAVGGPSAHWSIVTFFRAASTPW